MEVTTLAYIAINKETNELFVGAKGQAAFSKVGSLKLSMNEANRYTNRYDYKSDEWEFYQIDSLTKEIRKVAK